ncbi:MAG: EAL domain-containing protein [Pseudomonadota bacterium]
MTSSTAPVQGDPDELVFLDEALPVETLHHSGDNGVWRVLIVDDDADVHAATTFALNNLPMQNRSLLFLHAYSAAQARTLLEHEKDIAVILLDVVMEQQDAGLQLVRFIRDDLCNPDTRIILRTGQPGYAPEMDAIRDFDINDYKTKSELTRIKLFTTVAAAIRSYEQICSVNASRRGLDRIVQASTELMGLHGMSNYAEGVLAQVKSLLQLDGDGFICVQDSLQSDSKMLGIVAASGNYHPYIGQTLGHFNESMVLDALTYTLLQRCNIYEERYFTLYFIGKSGQDYLAYFHTDHALTASDQRLLEVFCSNIAVGLENVLLVSNLHNFAFYDQLSKLPNRTRLIDMVDDTLNSSSRSEAILALLDIDHFADTNDALGHQFGDLLLLAVAARLKSDLGEAITIARVGSDIFALLGNETQVDPIKTLSLFNSSFSIDDQSVQLSATMGLVRLSDYEGTGAEALKDADIALKRAKGQQRKGYFYFTRSMGVEIRERVRIMRGLRTAFEKRQLYVVYQPQIDLASRQPIGAEALLRWELEDGSFISPNRFIPIAEHSGLIVEMGEWVLRTACMELVRLRRAGHTNFMMSVNVSQAQFRHPHFLDMMRATFAETEAPPEFIELEITESMAMDEPELLIQLLEQIKLTGVSIAIDDFGTGFSSLSYLQQLKVDRLKIDRAFVTETTSSSRGSSIAKMVIQLGHNLGLSVIAEGVEDEEQASILSGLGCLQAQGFLFARPMTSAALNTWLENTTKHPKG